MALCLQDALITLSKSEYNTLWVWFQWLYGNNVRFRIAVNIETYHVIIWWFLNMTYHQHCTEKIIIIRFSIVFLLSSRPGHHPSFYQHVCSRVYSCLKTEYWLWASQYWSRFRQSSLTVDYIISRSVICKCFKIKSSRRLSKAIQAA